MEFEDLTIVKGGKQKGSPIFDRIMNDHYDKNVISQQDQFVDNQSTMGSRLATGSHTVDRMNAMKDSQALVDNSLDFIPGSRMGKIIENAKQGSNIIKNADDAKLLLSNASRDTGILNRMTLNKDTFAYVDPITNAVTAARNVKDGFRGVGKNMSRLAKDRPQDMQRASPTYREVPMISHKKADGSYSNPRGTFFSGGNANHILTSKQANYTNKASTVAKGSTKRHEYNHNAWSNKYGATAFNSRTHSPIVWDSRNFNPRSPYNDSDYYGTPWEVNARARQWSNILNKKNKTTEDTKLLAELAETTGPYLKGFADKYPDEVGAKLYNKLAAKRKVGTSIGGMEHTTTSKKRYIR